MRTLLSAISGLAIACCAARPLEIYLAPHAHCDAGWLFTVDAYYNDWHDSHKVNKNGPHGAVRDILNSVFTSLSADSTLRFNWAETVWFSKWWAEQNDENKAEMRKLVANGQWEFVGGGWVQSDEIITHWKDVTDQMMVGHEELRRIFGGDSRAYHHRHPHGSSGIGGVPKVRSGWQLDMFSGFSGTTPSLWYQAGFDAEVIRFEPKNEDMRDEWEKNQQLEFLWSQPDVVLGVHRQDRRRRQAMLTHAIRTDYSEVVNLGFSFNPSDEPVTTENIAERSATLVEWARNSTSVYKQEAFGSDRLLALWGSDFRFGNAVQWFGNMSLVVDFINANSAMLFNGATIKMSTVSEYMDRVEASMKQPGNLDFAIKEGIDFAYGWPRQIPLPNGNTSLQYTTGALSSRARFKQLIRQIGAQQRSAEIAFTLRLLAAQKEGVQPMSPNEQQVVFARLDAGRKALALVQHHDAITGTMFKNQSMDSYECCEPCSTSDCRVLEDYTAKIKSASANATAILEAAVGALTGGGRASDAANASDDAPSVVTVAVFNSLAHARTSEVFVPVVGPCVSVRDDSTRSVVPSQLNSNSTGVFFAASVPGFAASIFTVASSASSDDVECASKPTPITKGPTVLENDSVEIQIDEDGFVSKLLDKASNMSTALRLGYGLYENVQGGAYSMVETQKSTPQPKLRLESVFSGPVFSEATFSNPKDMPGVKQTLRVASASGNPLVRVTNELLKPNPLQTELTAEYYTELRNDGGYLWNDDSGLIMHQRVPDANLPIAARFHAAVQSIYLVDEDEESGAASALRKRQFSVLVEHSTGVASLADGKLEFILQRRVNTTDNQGPWPMNDGDGDGDDSLLESVHGLLFGPAETANEDRLRIAIEMENPLSVVHLLCSSEACAPSSFSPLRESVLDVDPGVHILNFKLRAVNPISAILQVQNMKQTGEPVRLDAPPSGLFEAGVTTPASACAELSLTLQSKLGDCAADGIELGVAPDIRTFVLDY